VIVSVIDSGAMGDGVTDDTASIQAAITDAAAGDVIHFPPGRKYMVNGMKGINIPSDRELALAGATVAIFPGATPTAKAFQTVPGSKNVRFVGGIIEGDMSPVPSGGWRIGLRGDSVAGMTVVGSIFRNWKTDGVWIGGNTPSTLVRLDSVVCEEFGRNGLSVVNASGVEIARCHFGHCPEGASPGAGVDVEPNPGERVVDLSLYECLAYDVEVGFYLQPGRGTPGESYRVYACKVEGGRKYGIICNSVIDAAIIDCRVEMPAAVEGQNLPVGISIGGATAETRARDVLLSNNHVTGGTRCFIFAGIDGISAIANEGRLETVALGVVGDSYMSANAFV
jgi:hypothetical protein